MTISENPPIDTEDEELGAEQLLALLASSMEELSEKERLEVRGHLVSRVIQMAREDFYTFVLLMAPHCLPEEFKNGRHIEVICKELQKIEKYVEATRKDGARKASKSNTGRLQVFLPPGAMKSVLGSRLFSAWVLGRHPKWRILAVGHSREFAIDNVGRPVRDLMCSDEYREIFPEVFLKEDLAAAGRWETQQGGQFYAAGAGTRIAGRRSHISICDDVISEQEAESENLRNKINRWYGKGLQSRLLPGAAEVIINCLEENTPVLMANGTWKKIKDVEKDDEVLTINPLDGMHQSKKVLAKIPQGKADVYEVKTRNSTVIATDRHPFLVEEKDGRLSYVPVKDLKVGENVMYSLNKFYEEDCDEAKINKKEAWLLGFMFGDGWTIQTSRTKGKQIRIKRYVTCAATSIHQELNQRVVNLFQELFGVDVHMTKFGYVRTDKRHVCEWLREHGLTGNAHTKRIPDWMFKQPDYIRTSFLEGFVSADGHINKKGMTIVGLCNHDLIMDIKHLVSALGFKTSNVYERTTFHKPPNSKEARDFTQYSIQWGKEKQEDEFITTKVVSIKKLPEQKEVYDLSIEDNENFIVNSIVCHNTRWHLMDLSGFTLKAFAKTTRPFRKISIPALLDEDAVKLLQRPDDPPDRFKVGHSFWPEFWPTQELIDKKEGGTLTPSEWNALYMQNPVPEEGNIVKYADFSDWDNQNQDGKLIPPDCQYTILSLDTAFSTKETADYSAYTLWGIFYKLETLEKGTETQVPQMILLASGKGRWEFPDLCAKVQDLYKKKSPDAVLIEKKASGQSLIQELRRRGLPVLEYMPERDKTSRLHACTPFFQSKRIWVPKALQWAKEFMTELVSFPHSKHDDAVDCTTQAILWMRDHWKMQHEGYSSFNEDMDEDSPRPKRRSSYWSATMNS